MLQRFGNARTREALRRCVDESRLRLRTPAREHWLVLSETNRIPQAMVDPLLRMQPEGDRVSVFEVSRRRAQATRFWRRASPSTVFIQSMPRVPRDELASLLADVRSSMPEAKVVWLDWAAPVHLSHGWVLDEVDLYVKKHLLRDRSVYVKGLHDTNLAEYEAQFDPGLLPPHQPGFERSLLDAKVVPGWNFGTVGPLRRALANHTDPAGPRRLAVHCRCATQGSAWYTHLRERGMDAARKLAFEPSVISEDLVPPAEFWSELEQSRLCISPFGYGEVCWRDFEAVAAGALLVKPDMSHLETSPDIYRPFETYVPVAWDWSDLEERCAWALESDERRIAIARNAVEVWREYLTDGWPSQFRALRTRLSADRADPAREASEAPK